MNMRFNKKGNMIDSMLMIFILLILFFMLASGITDLMDGVISFAPDTTQTFMLQLFVPFMLVGILTVVFKRGAAGQ